MNSGSVIAFALFGAAYGLMDNRLDRIEARLSEADRRIALLAEELGDGVHGRRSEIILTVPNATDTNPDFFAATNGIMLLRGCAE